MGFINEPGYNFDFLVGERLTLSADNVTLANGQNLTAGTILAKTFVGTAAGANAAGNTGNPTVGAIVVGTQAEPGLYSAVFNAATTFEVYDPRGVYLGNGVLGTSFVAANRVTFTLTAGGVAAVSGDQFNIFVTEGASTYQASVGPDASAILGVTTNATAGATLTVAITRLAEYDINKVNFGTMDATHQAAAVAALARKNLISRGGF